MKNFYKAGLISATLLMSSPASATVEVTLTNVFACPLFLSTTSVANTASIKFQYMFEWQLITLGSTTTEDAGPDCCSFVYQKGLIPTPNTAYAIWTNHYLNPAQGGVPGTVPSWLNNELTADCPYYIASMDIYTSLCKSIATGGSCNSNTLNASDNQMPTLDLNDPKNIKLASNPDKPLLIENEKISTRDELVAMLKPMAQLKSFGEYKPLTNIEDVFRYHHCEKIDSASVVLDERRRNGLMVYQCAVGYVLAHEVSYGGKKNVAVAEGATPITLPNGRQYVAQYIINKDRKRKSSVSLLGSKTALYINLYHNDDTASPHKWLASVLSHVEVYQ
ncbi:MAG: hypothetical protein QM667_09065 [Asticcacaulis sp.]